MEMFLFEHVLLASDSLARFGHLIVAVTIISLYRRHEIATAKAMGETGDGGDGGGVLLDLFEIPEFVHLPAAFVFSFLRHPDIPPITVNINESGVFDSSAVFSIPNRAGQTTLLRIGKEDPSWQIDTTPAQLLVSDGCVSEGGA